MLADYGAEVIQINKPVDGPLPISTLHTFMYLTSIKGKFKWLAIF